MRRVQGAKAPVTADTLPDEARPINPIAALTLVLAFPGRTFQRLVERPHWIVPLVFVMGAAVLSGLLALSAGFMDDSIQLQAFRTGHDPAEIRAGAPAAMVVSGVVGVVGATLLQTLLFVAIARVFGGRGTFRRAFSAVCHASVPIGLSAILVTALIPFTHRALSGLSLAFAVDRSKTPFLWGLASQLDVAVIWFFVLLGIAAEPVFGLPRRRARMVAVVFGVVSVLVLGWLGRGEAARRVDPFADWSALESDTTVLHFSGDAPRETVATAELVCERAARRVREWTGPFDGGRIECFLYPSLGEKLRVTDNDAIAHRVEWANAVHVAWVEGAEPALTREMFKLADAGGDGKVYTPLIRDGLAVYAGRRWGGMDLREAGRDLIHRNLLPALAALADSSQFVQLDERISQPAAGSFMAFIIDEAGRGTAGRLYSGAAGQSGDCAAAIERELGDSLAGVEARWHAYLTAD